MSLEVRIPTELPLDPDITAELLAADERARRAAAARAAELLERLRQL